MFVYPRPIKCIGNLDVSSKMIIGWNLTIDHIPPQRQYLSLTPLSRTAIAKPFWNNLTQLWSLKLTLRHIRVWTNEEQSYAKIVIKLWFKIALCLSSPRAESARAVTGRRCPHSAQCVLCKVYFSAQPNKLRPILKFKKILSYWTYICQACSSARKIHYFKF